MHDLSEPAKRIADGVTFICAGVAVISLAQLAVVLTIISTIIAIILGGIRIYDRLKHGRGGE